MQYTLQNSLNFVQNAILTFAVICSIIIKHSARADRQVGVIDAEGPPVPIPNTEVKLCRAENTWLEAAREDRYSPTQQPRSEFVLTSRCF